MQKFIKLDLRDEDVPVRSSILAEDIGTLLKDELRKYQDDVDFEPCDGLVKSECFTSNGDSIQWSPGNGGTYTVAVYAPNTPEGFEQLKVYLEDGDE